VEERSAAEDIMKKLSQGESFSKLAKQYSIDPLSSGNGGDLGFIEPDQMPKEFDRVLFHMKPGDISSIIRTDFGFHIIKCGEIIPPKKIATETTTEKIRNFLRQERQRDLFDRWFERIKNDARVEINPDVFPTTPGLKTSPSIPKGKNNLQSRYDG
jgi:parvulin-like peptidyl-prolyl isomerase